MVPAPADADPSLPLRHPKTLCVSCGQLCPGDAGESIPLSPEHTHPQDSSQSPLPDICVPQTAIRHSHQSDRLRPYHGVAGTGEHPGSSWDPQLAPDPGENGHGTFRVHTPPISSSSTQWSRVGVFPLEHSTSCQGWPGDGSLTGRV